MKPIAVAVLATTSRANDLLAKARDHFQPLPSTVPAQIDNTITDEKTELGKTVSFDPRLSASGVFSGKGCTACNAGTDVGGEGSFPFGLIAKPGAEMLPEGDKGRFAVTETADDEHVSRAATMRNIALTAPCFHAGKVWGLEGAAQIMAESRLGEALADDGTAKSVAVLDLLTGERPEIITPVLPPETADMPRPSAEVLP